MSTLHYNEHRKTKRPGGKRKPFVRLKNVSSPEITNVLAPHMATF